MKGDRMGDHVPPLYAFSPEQRDKMLEDVAQRIARAGMATPAMIFLESNKPFSRIAANALHIVSPAIGVFLPNIDAYGALLQDRENVDMLIFRLEEIEEERGQQQRALRAERKARVRERKLRAKGRLTETEPEPGRPPDSPEPPKQR
jgi:hypothetical protein